MRKSHLVQPIAILVALLTLEGTASAVLVNAGVVSGNQSVTDVSFDTGGGVYPIDHQAVHWPAGFGLHTTSVSDQSYTNGPDTMVAGYSASGGADLADGYGSLAMDYSLSGPDIWTSGVSGDNEVSWVWDKFANEPSPDGIYPPDYLLVNIDSTVTGYLAPGDSIHWQFAAAIQDSIQGTNYLTPINFGGGGDTPGNFSKNFNEFMMYRYSGYDSFTLPITFFNLFNASIVKGSDGGTSYINLDPSFSVTAISEPSGLLGDYNRNGVVDAADYTLWRDSLRQTGAGLAADGDGNGVVDQQDYDIWAANFGQTATGAGASSSTNVPEPSSIALACLAATGLAASSFQRQRYGRT